MNPPTSPAAAAKTPMVLRTLRVPSELWTDAAEKAATEDPPRGVTELVRDLLECYRTGQVSGKPR